MDQTQIESSHVQCKNCGSALFYDPKTQELKCKSCSSLTNFEKTRDEIKKDFIEGSSVENNSWAKESRVFRCETCGAQVVMTGFDVTTSCPYCGSTYVTETDQLPGLKPDRVIPFAFNEKDAALEFAKGVRKRFFAPSKLKKKMPESSIRGLYVPTFTFDADTSSDYSGVLEKVEYRTDSKGKSHRTVRRFNISGSVDKDFLDIVVESSSRLDSKQMNSLLPYDMEKAYHFDVDFLRGYTVEHYQDSLDTCYLSAKSHMDSSIKNEILRRYSYSSIVSLNIKTLYSNKKYSYTLLPIYTFEFTYGKKHFITLLNGQTGRIGKGLPISKLKVAITIGIAVAILIVLIIIFLVIN